MPSVEIEIPSAEIDARMEHVRRWLRQRGCVFKLASIGSRDELVVVVDFLSGADADEFARRFGGSLVAGWMG